MPPTAPAEPAASMSVAATARALGCHRATVRRLIAAGRLDALRLGRPPRGHLRVSAASLDAFLAGAREEPDHAPPDQGAAR